MNHKLLDAKDEIYFIAPPDVAEEQLVPQDTSQQAAFDPETKQINWDCPCLGDLPHGVILLSLT